MMSLTRWSHQHHPTGSFECLPTELIRRSCMLSLSSVGRWSAQAIPIPGISLNDHITDKGTITLSYHGRNHYNLLRKQASSSQITNNGRRQSAYDEQHDDSDGGNAGVDVSRGSAVAAQEKSQEGEAGQDKSPANDDPDDDDSLSVGEPPDNARLQSFEGLSPGWSRFTSDTFAHAGHF